MHTIFTILLILLSVLSLYAQMPLYTLESFTASSRTIPASGNTIIAPLVGDTLTRIEEATQLSPEEMILRRRFSPDEYGLYLGKKNRDTFTALSAFAPPPELTTQNFMYRKLYMQETDNPNMDMTNVYFDNEYIYVENAAKIFFHENGWKEIGLLELRSAALSIISFPAGATVIVDGVERGETPLIIKKLPNPFVILKVYKKGYYQKETFVNLSEAAVIEKQFSLKKMISSSEGAYINPESYAAEDEESLNELDEQIMQQKQRIQKQQEVNSDALARFERDFPPFRSQGEFEKTADFLQRKELYDQKKTSGKMAVMLEGEPKIHRLETTLHKLTKYYAEIENRLYHHYLSAEIVKLSRYEPDLEYFPIDLSVIGGGHNFSFSGNIQIPLSMAPEFKQNLSEGRLKLTYQNRIFKQGESEYQLKILYEYTKLSILYKGGEYVLEGRCSFPRSGETAEAVADLRTKRNITTHEHGSVK